jgi:hypothetical protein
LHSRELTILGGSLDREIVPTGTDGPFYGRLTETVAAEVILPASSGGHCSCRRQAGHSVESSHAVRAGSEDPVDDPDKLFCLHHVASNDVGEPCNRNRRTRS